MIRKRMQTESMWGCEIALKAITKNTKYIYLKEKRMEKRGKSQISIVVKLGNQKSISVVSYW